MNSIPHNLGSLTRELLSAEIRCEPETAQEICSEVGIPYTGAGLLVTATWLKAFKGDVNAAKLIREMNGESNDTDNAVDLSAMSDAALLALANGTSDTSAYSPAQKAAEDSAADGMLGSTVKDSEPAEDVDNGYPGDEIPW